MQSTYTHPADFRQERDFGKKLGATFEFIGAHFRPLGKCLLYFVLPLALVMGIGLGLAMNIIWGMASQSINDPQHARPDDLLSPAYFAGMGLTMLGGVLSVIMLVSTVYAYLRLVLELEAAPTPAQVWQQIKRRVGRMLLALVTFFGLYVLLLLGIVGLSQLDEAAGLLLVLVFPVLIYASVPLSLFFPVLWLEDGNMWQALTRCFYLAKGKWWSTLGLLIIASMIQGMISILFALPQYAVLFGKILKIAVLETDAFGVITQCIFSLGIMLTYTIPMMAAAFQYFNLVERREGLGLRGMLDSLGQGPAPVAYNHHYRPDDEGEY